MVGMYMRISHEDLIGKESESIDNQRKILRNFAHSLGYINLKEYIDDGFSGVNFQRPALNRLLKDIKEGLISVVISKDLSRLGRNSAMVSQLLDEYFPENNVRYFSVNEGIDTDNVTNFPMVASITNVVNELYARDISNKIRSALRAKVESGEYIGSFAPYGYAKDACNKNKLIIDKKIQHIVKLIFNMAKTGLNPAQIADSLNRQKISTPLVYRRTGSINSHASSPKWKSSNVLKILQNVVYCGHIAQNKFRKISFKSKNCKRNRKKDWIVVKNMHDPIVDEKSWEEVQRLILIRTNSKLCGFKNIFSGIARCGDCGKNMSTVNNNKKGSTANLACGKYKAQGKLGCTNHHVDYDMLCQIVLNAIKNIIYTSKIDIKLLYLKIKKGLYELYNINSNMSVNFQKQQIQNKIQKLYDDKYEGNISCENFDFLLKKYELEKNNIQNIEGPNFSQNIDISKLISNTINSQKNIEKLSQKLLVAFVEKIEIFQGEIYDIQDKYKNISKIKKQKIKIYTKCKCENLCEKIHI